jgi:hypothetical protein
MQGDDIDNFETLVKTPIQEKNLSKSYVNQPVYNIRVEDVGKKFYKRTDFKFGYYLWDSDKDVVVQHYRLGNGGDIGYLANIPEGTYYLEEYESTVDAMTPYYCKKQSLKIVVKDGKVSYYPANSAFETSLKKRKKVTIPVNRNHSYTIPVFHGENKTISFDGKIEWHMPNFWIPAYSLNRLYRMPTKTYEQMIAYKKSMVPGHSISKINTKTVPELLNGMDFHGNVLKGAELYADVQAKSLENYEYKFDNVPLYVDDQHKETYFYWVEQVLPSMYDQQEVGLVENAEAIEFTPWDDGVDTTDFHNYLEGMAILVDESIKNNPAPDLSKENEITYRLYHLDRDGLIDGKVIQQFQVGRSGEIVTNSLKPGSYGFTVQKPKHLERLVGMYKFKIETESRFVPIVTTHETVKSKLPATSIKPQRGDIIFVGIIFLVGTLIYFYRQKLFNF